MSGQGRASAFVVARNPQDDSKLPYLLRLPIEGGLVLKARERWPTTARVYCHRFEDAWPEDTEIVEQTPALLCRRRGAAIEPHGSPAASPARASPSELWCQAPRNPATHPTRSNLRKRRAQHDAPAQLS